MLICEAFEDLVQAMPDPVSYQALCQKVLPSLIGAFDVANVTSDDPLVTVSPLSFCVVAITIRGTCRQEITNHCHYIVCDRANDFSNSIRLGATSSRFRCHCATQAEQVANGKH